MANIARKDLEKVLEEVIQKLIKTGLLPNMNNEQKINLIQNVANKLINDPQISLSTAELGSDEIKKSLGIACMSEFKLKPDSKFDYRLLFKNKMEPELEDQIKDLLVQALKLTPENKHKKQEELEDELEPLAKILAERVIKDNFNLMLNFLGSLLNLQPDPLAENRRTLYGIDTHTPGEVQRPVLAVVNGDPGIMDLAVSGPSFMGVKGNDNPGVEDPIGIVLFSIGNALSMGDTSPNLERRFVEEGLMQHQSPAPGPGPKPR